MDKKEKLKKIIAALRTVFKNAECALTHKSPLQLAVATILSAQCTDERVNKVTPALFKKYPNAKAFAEANIYDLETAIHSTGFYKNKAKSIHGFCRGIITKHKGAVPKTLKELVKLPGIGRKTANVILGVWWNIPGIVVDTHVTRLTNRMGLTRETDPVKIEFEMMKLCPKKDWNDFGLFLIQHGRKFCMARNPQCSQCPLEKICPKVGV